jgi:hypothetical protein
MKIIKLTLLLVFLLHTGLFAQSSGDPYMMKPTNYVKRVTTIIAGKSRSYYSLDSDEASVISLKGPGILKVMSRGRFVPGESEKISYEILYSVNGAEEKMEKVSSVIRSKKATYKNGSLGVPGQLKDFEIELGRGNHTIEFNLADNETPVAARYRFTPTKAKKQQWVAYSPLSPCDPVELITREESVKYYRFSIEMPLKFEVCGPTKLRVLTRSENHYQMKGRILYRLQVKQDGQNINTYQLSSRRSDVTMYKENMDLIPGKACEFVITVPKGKHTYEILPLDKDKKTVLGRCLIPEKDISIKH